MIVVHQTFLSISSGITLLGLMNLPSVIDLVALNSLLLRVTEIPKADQYLSFIMLTLLQTNCQNLGASKKFYLFTHPID